MNIIITHTEQVAPQDYHGRDVSRYVMSADVDGTIYDLEVFVNHDNDNYIEFDTPEQLQEELEGEESDALFLAVVGAINA